MAEGETGRNKFARRGGLVVALLVLVIFGVYAGWGRRAGAPPSGAATPAASPVAVTGGSAPGSADAAAAPADAASVTQGRIEFASGSARLPAAASDLLVRIADAVRLVPGGKVEIVAWRPTGADSLLARERAETARHALEANGVPPGQMRVVVQEAPAGTAAVEAERVELQVR
jgi:outer membrane protein OmpA-like peptidoglycan-associated protein